MRERVEKLDVLGWNKSMTSNYYVSQMGFAFLPPHNPVDYPPSMGNAQYQVLGTENFRQNQGLFRKYTAIDDALKNKIITTVEPVFLSPLVDQLTGYVQVSALTMLQHLFLSYGKIDEINLEEMSSILWGPTTPQNPWPN